jgi:hypothetical protein
VRLLSRDLFQDVSGTRITGMRTRSFHFHRGTWIGWSSSSIT